MTADHLWLDQVTPPRCTCGHTMWAHPLVQISQGTAGDAYAPGQCGLMCCDCREWALPPVSISSSASDPRHEFVAGDGIEGPAAPRCGVNLAGLCEWPRWCYRLADDPIHFHLPEIASVP